MWAASSNLSVHSLIDWSGLQNPGACHEQKYHFCPNFRIARTRMLRYDAELAPFSSDRFVSHETSFIQNVSAHPGAAAADDSPGAPLGTRGRTYRKGRFLLREVAGCRRAQVLSARGKA